MVGCIALGWLCIFMLFHKEIEMLEISTYSWLPHFLLTMVIDRHRHYHHLLHFHYH